MLRPPTKLVGLLAMTLGWSLPAYAPDVYLGLEAYGRPAKLLGLGIGDFVGVPPTPELTDWAQKSRAILREDILFSRLFNVVEGGPTPRGSENLDALVWASLGAEVVLAGDVQQRETQRVIRLRAYDVRSGKPLLEKESVGAPDSHRRMMHLLADAMIQQFSGQPGIAHTRVVFVNNQTGHKELYVMDYDGFHARRLTSDRSIAVLPRWSPDGKEIAFNSYRDRNPDAYVMEFLSGRMRALSMRQGLNTAIAWSPDGQRVALTLSRDGDPELYLLDRQGKMIRRLTYSPGVDTSPTFSPSGQQICFVSDRGGVPNLFVMNIEGGSTRRLTYGSWVDSPHWSPRGDWIAFTKKTSSGYDIALIDPAGSREVQITSNAGRNENSSFSPDGRFLTFSSTRNGKSEIFAASLDGSFQTRIANLPGSSFTPSWSP